MSRRYEATRKRKAKRQKARADAEKPDRAHSAQSWSIVIPIALIVAIPAFTAIGLLATQADHVVGRQQVRQEVNSLLVGIPQHGTTLGSTDAPVTLWIFADLECLDVKRFVFTGLRSIVASWVRNGTMKIEYRSLQTDTKNQNTFARQEIAARAAGKQNKMWNFALTFIYEQGLQGTSYATDGFLTGIASQVQGLKMARWRQDRKDPELFTQVARSDYSARANKFIATPTFVIGRTGGEINQVIGRKKVPGRLVDATTLQRYVESLN